jgi:uncharacterized protein with HEPN domain
MEKALKYLSDIKQAIELIEDFTASTNSFNDYLVDIKTQSAVERQLGIIGEAVNKFDQLNSIDSLKSSRQIVGFRHRIIHAYDSVDASMVWAIIKNHLPELKNEVLQKLGHKN